MLGLFPLLSGCVGAVALPLVAGGAFMVRDAHRVRAATPVPDPSPSVTLQTPQGREAAALAEAGVEVSITSLRELPPPSQASAAVSDRWERFFDYVLEQGLAPEGEVRPLQSALLRAPPSIDSPERRDCPAPPPAVVIDLDDGENPFVPEDLTRAPNQIAAGLSRLREAGITVLWISRLPAARVTEVAQALRSSGLDPQGQDQLLLVRNAEDRKQVLREDANQDVCVVAIAGDERSDFDELFDYLRNPGSAVGLYPMMGKGWFLVPSLTAPATASD